MSEIMRMENITKQFGAVTANRQVCLTVQEGEVHTLLGENGAGKSTLMNVLIGLYQPTAGDIYIRGKKVKIDSPATAVKLGVGMVHQHFMLIEAMTVFENIILGTTRDRSLFIRKDRIKKEILELSEKYGLDVDLDKRITDISVGAQQRVEILKALYRGAELLILDEPTAVLTDEEVVGLFGIIRRLKSENKSVIFISHKMREVMEISDKVTILRAGQSVMSLDKSDTAPEELASLMIGRELTVQSYEKGRAQAQPVISLNHVSYHKASKHEGLNDISLEIKKGEILGIAGVDGNGQSQLSQLVTGILAPEEGELFLKGEKVLKFTPKRFIDSRVSHIPEDRNKMGLVGDFSIAENLVLKDTETEAFSEGRGLLLKKKQIAAYAEQMKEKYDIRCSGIGQNTRSLSGGNQQKVILARELEREPELLIAVHPTRGLDIGATRYVHDSMIKARDSGCAVLLVSADIEEVVELSDRICVMFEGRIMGTYDGGKPPMDRISMAMAGKCS